MNPIPEKILRTFEQVVAAAARNLGLIFVNGPSPQANPPPTGYTGDEPVNGQYRALYQFSVAVDDLEQ